MIFKAMFRRAATLVLVSGVIVETACGGGLPDDHGVTWACSGTVSVTPDGFVDPIPVAEYGGGCDAREPGLHVTEFANPDVSQSAVANQCNDDCGGQFLNYADGHQITFPDGPITCTTNAATPCTALHAPLVSEGPPVQLMNGGPADVQQSIPGQITLSMNGDAAAPHIAGLMDYSVGLCDAATCDFVVPRLAAATTEAFVIQGLNVTSASIQSIGPIHGTLNGSQLTLPAGSVVGEINFMANGVPASESLTNNNPIVGTVVPAQSLTLSGQLGSGAQTVGIAISGGAVIGHRPQASFTPGNGSIIECTSPRGGLVTLTSASQDQDNDLRFLLWNVDGVSRSTAVTFETELTFGVHAVRLTVGDTRGAMASATSALTVGDHQAPVFTFVPPDTTISQCASPILAVAKATDACGPVVVTNDAPAKFPLGKTTVTWTARDSVGNVATATQIVTAVLGDDASCCPAGTHIVVGTSNNDILVGTAGADCILGLGGQDQISGSGGDDYISGGDGDDVIDGGSGDDRIWGGNGQDQLSGGSGNDLIDGGGGDDTCHGGDGNDVIHGGSGQDKLFGDSGHDHIFGEDGDDVLDGGVGNDLLNGGGIHDLCVGGGGTDTFFLCEQAR